MMSQSLNHKPVVIIPNLNGGDELLEAIESLTKQTAPCHIIVVDNASTDGSAKRAQVQYPDVEFIWHDKNLGYAGGVNPGFHRAIELGAIYVAPFNDDAIAKEDWLEKLVDFMDSHEQYGAACAKVMKSDGKMLDSTGDYITNWGLPYPRGRGEVDTGQYDQSTEIFSASGAASLYRIKALKQVGLLDEDFFAYYEDVDLSFRLQLAGWKVGFVPEAVVYHKVGMTSGRIKGFTTLQTMKNQPLLLWKNLPARLLPRVLPRFYMAYFLFFARAVSRKQSWYAAKGAFLCSRLFLKKLTERHYIQKQRTVSDDYVWNMMVHDLPPNAHALRKLRSKWHHLTRK